jgi:hypothetical protein
MMTSEKSDFVMRDRLVLNSVGVCNSHRCAPTNWHQMGTEGGVVAVYGGQ